MIDKTEEMRWIAPVRAMLNRVPEVFVYFNNHYAGYGPGPWTCSCGCGVRRRRGWPRGSKGARVELQTGGAGVDADPRGEGEEGE